MLVGLERLLCCSKRPWWSLEEDKVEEFVALLAKAFSLDIHDFNMVMNERKQIRQACASVVVLSNKGTNTPEYHTLKIAMALIETSGFVYIDGVC
jgi:hypothetical protein